MINSRHAHAPVAQLTMASSSAVSALLLCLLLHVDVINGDDCSPKQCQACECKGECRKLVVCCICDS